MERKLRIIYLYLYPIVTLLLFFILKKEGGMAIGFFIIFILISFPFLCINIGRSYLKIEKWLFIFNISYLLLFITYCWVLLAYEGSLFAFGGLLLTILLIYERFRKKQFVLLNIIGLFQLIFVLLYPLV